MNEDKLLVYMDIYLTNEPSYIDGSYNFFDLLPLEIESIKIIDNTRYERLKAYDSNDNEIEFKVDKRGIIRTPRNKKTIRTGAWFPYFHKDNNLDLSMFQIFNKNQ
jgi:hypothetical protein